MIDVCLWVCKTVLVSLDHYAHVDARSAWENEGGCQQQHAERFTLLHHSPLAYYRCPICGSMYECASGYIERVYSRDGWERRGRHICERCAKGGR